MCEFKYILKNQKSLKKSFLRNLLNFYHTEPRYLELKILVEHFELTRLSKIGVQILTEVSSW